LKVSEIAGTKALIAACKRAQTAVFSESIYGQEKLCWKKPTHGREARRAGEKVAAKKPVRRTKRN
jgi:hypothetical protein